MKSEKETLAMAMAMAMEAKHDAFKAHPRASLEAACCAIPCASEQAAQSKPKI
jgi:hypothetical protein